MTDPIRTNPVQPTQPSQPGGKPQSAPQDVSGPGFEDILSQQLRFSNHAQKRLDRRSIDLGNDGLARLTQAVEKAEKRGGRESLVVVDDMAFIVNIRERLVVTALDRNKTGDGVFTQIDSVVFADPKQENGEDQPPSQAGTSTTSVEA